MFHLLCGINHPRYTGRKFILQTPPSSLNFFAILGDIFLYWYACNPLIRDYKGNGQLHIEPGAGKQQSLAN
jgi:hypothetical protein